MSTATPVLPRSLFAFSVFYGGMACIAGVLGAKQIALGPLAAEGGMGAFLLLVAVASAVTELHGKAAADSLVRFGFVPLIACMALIRLVLALPADGAMPAPLAAAFPIVLAQGARMMLAGLIAYGVSQTLNVLIFDRLAGRGANPAPSRRLWLRAMLASVASQIVDVLLFISISFLGVRPIGTLLLGQMAAKVTLSILLVPFLVTALVALGRRLDRAE